MGILSQSADLYYTYKFIKLLVTPWKDTEAYKLGIIDDKGKVLIRPSKFTTSQQKDAYTFFNRLVFNIKRLIEKVPGGSSRIASYAAALYLLKEELGLSDKNIEMILKKMEVDVDTAVNESVSSWYILGDNSLAPGTYTLKQDIAIPSTGEMQARAGTRVIVHEGTYPSGHVFAEPIYKVSHTQTKQEIYISATDIIR
jgi:hypothetical protein